MARCSATRRPRRYGSSAHHRGEVHVTIADTRRDAPASARLGRGGSKLGTSGPMSSCPSPPRPAPLLDLATIERPRDVERALEEGIVRKILRISDVEDLLRRASGLRGAPLLAGILERRRGPTVTRSEAEERFLSLIREALLPPPEINVSVHGYEVDFLWRNAAARRRSRRLRVSRQPRCVRTRSAQRRTPPRRRAEHHARHVAADAGRVVRGHRASRTGADLGRCAVRRGVARRHHTSDPPGPGISTSDPPRPAVSRPSGGWLVTFCM